MDVKSLLTFLFLAVFLFGQAQQPDSLTILSWNVFLRPAILNDHQMERVDSIAQYLLSSEADVLVLQEVFHKKASTKLLNTLGEKYSFQAGPGKKGLIKLSSGVVILSKYEITGEEIEIFKERKGADALAKKSAISVFITKKDKKIQLIGTHLQAGNGGKREEIRVSQQEQVAQLLRKYKDSVDIQLTAGDFNTATDTKWYIKMHQLLNTKNGKLTGKHKHTSNLAGNGLFDENGTKGKWIDFILKVKSSGGRIKRTWIEHPTANWSEETNFLSDHNPVWSVVGL